MRQYYRDDSNDNITQSESFKYKIKIRGNTPANGNTKDFKIEVLLKYLSTFRGTFKMLLINFEFSLYFAWSKKCVIYLQLE